MVYSDKLLMVYFCGFYSYCLSEMKAYMYMQVPVQL